MSYIRAGQYGPMELLDKITENSIDLTCDKGVESIQVEHDEVRGVLYVHVNGITVFRACRAKGLVTMTTISEIKGQ